MSVLIEELKKEHSEIVATLNEVTELGISSTDGQANLMFAKVRLACPSFELIPSSLTSLSVAMISACSLLNSSISIDIFSFSSYWYLVISPDL